MSENDPDDSDDEQPENCPICDTPIQATERPDPVTYTLQPCGHQVDEHVYEDLRNGTD